jgi:hypothetical protein
MSLSDFDDSSEQQTLALQLAQARWGLNAVVGYGTLKGERKPCFYVGANHMDTWLVLGTGGSWSQAFNNAK